jgi:hypothetical protein
VSDCSVRTIGHAADTEGSPVPVGVSEDGDVVILGYRLARDEAEEFGRLFVRACLEASAQGGAT